MPKGEILDIKPISESDMNKKIAEKTAKQIASIDNQPIPPTPTPQATTTDVKPEIKTPEVKEPVKPEVKAEEKKAEPRKTIKEIAKPFKRDAKETVVDVKTDEIPETLKPKFEAYQKEIEDYKRTIEQQKLLLDNPDIQTVIEAGKAGKNAIDIFREVMGNTVDTKKLTDAQVYELGLKNNGVKPASELDKDSEEPSLEEEMEKFKSMGKLAQKREADAIRQDIEKGNSNVSSTFLNKIKEFNTKSDAAKIEEQRKTSIALERTQKELNDIADAYVGKEHYAVVGTPQMADSIKNFKLSDLIPTNEDGSLNAERLFDLIHYVKFGDLRLAELENRIGADKYDEYRKEVEVTKGASTSIVRAPQGTEQYKTDKEKREYIHAHLAPVN